MQKCIGIGFFEHFLFNIFVTTSHRGLISVNVKAPSSRLDRIKSIYISFIIIDINLLLLFQVKLKLISQ